MSLKKNVSLPRETQGVKRGRDEMEKSQESDDSSKENHVSENIPSAKRAKVATHVPDFTRTPTISTLKLPDAGYGLAVFGGLIASCGGVKSIPGADDDEENTFPILIIDTNMEVKQMLDAHTGMPEKLLFISKERLLSGARDGTMRLWDISTGKCLRVFEGHTDQINDVVYNETRGMAYTSSNDKTIREWDINTGASRVIYTSQYSTKALYLQENYLFFGSKHVHRLNLIQETLKIFEGPLIPHAIRPFQLPDGRQVFACDNTKFAVDIWDIKTGEQIKLLPEIHDAMILGLEVQENYLISSDWVGTICIWDIAHDFMLVQTIKTEEFNGQYMSPVQCRNASFYLGTSDKKLKRIPF